MCLHKNVCPVYPPYKPDDKMAPEKPGDNFMLGSGLVNREIVKINIHATLIKGASHKANVAAG